MEETTNGQIELQDQNFGFEGGKITLAVSHDYEINNKKVHVDPMIVIFDGKNKVSIRSKNAFDAILKALRSQKGKVHRELLADTLSIDEIETKPSTF